MRKLIVLSTLALAACAVQPQRPRVSAADDPSNACFLSTDTDADFAVLKTHLMLLHPEAASLEMLTDTARPTDEEKRSLSLWAKRRSVCVEMGRSFRQQYFPAAIPTYENQQVALLQLIAELYAGKRTYGEFNVTRQQLAQQARAELVEVDRRRRTEAEAREAAQRAANAEAARTFLLLQAMQPKPAYVPMPSQQINCTSVRNGIFTNTTCN